MAAAVVLVGVVTSLVIRMQGQQNEKRVLDKGRMFASLLGAHLDRIAGDNIAAYKELQSTTVTVGKWQKDIRVVRVMHPEGIVLSSSDEKGMWKRAEGSDLSAVQEVAHEKKSKSVVQAGPGGDSVMHYMPIFGPGAPRTLIGVMQIDVQFPAGQGNMAAALRGNKSAYFRKEAAGFANQLALRLRSAVKQVQANAAYMNELITKMAADEELMDVSFLSKDLRVLGSVSGRGLWPPATDEEQALVEDAITNGAEGARTVAGVVDGHRVEAIQMVSPLYLTSGGKREIVGAVGVLLSLDRIRRLAAGRRHLIVAVGAATAATLCLLIGLVAKIRSQREIQEWNVRLQERVDEISAELKEQQVRLVESEKLAGLGILSSGIAHEINNPLGVILGDSQMLLEEIAERPPSKEGEETAELLRAIERNAKRCSQIVKNLLQFAKSRELELKETSVAEVLDRALEFSASHLAGKGVEISRDIRDDLPAVHANAIQLEQVFVNIIMNAVHSVTDAGRVSIAAGRAKSAAGDVVEVRFDDNGAGISREDIGKIFDPFFTTKDPGSGIGLGLSVSYGIIQAHGGDISVKSTAGEGTSVTVTLPLKG